MKHYFEKTTGKHFGSVSIGGIEVPEEYDMVENELSYSLPIVLRNGNIVEQIQSVSMAQARIALIGMDLIDKVDSAIDTIVDAKEKAKAKTWWEYAQTVDRHSAIVQQLITALGLSDEQVDELLSIASNIK
jgi:hypothetical protein